MRELTLEQRTQESIYREELIFGNQVDWSKEESSLKVFQIDFGAFAKLVNSDAVVLTDSQNNSPTIEQFYEFAQEFAEIYKINNGFTFHGYAISPERKDCRISIEAIEINSLQPLPSKALSLFLDYLVIYRKADSFKMEETRLYAWWD